MKPDLVYWQSVRHFKMREFACPCCGAAPMLPAFIGALDRLRHEVDRPLTISSGYRCARHNEAVGGAPHSLHRDGLAADVAVPRGDGVLRWLIVANATRQALSVGVYGRHIHLDDRPGPAVLFHGSYRL